MVKHPLQFPKTPDDVLRLLVCTKIGALFIPREIVVRLLQQVEETTSKKSAMQKLSL